MTQEEVVIVGAARTPIGRFGGAFRQTPAHVLGAIATKCALERAGVELSSVDEVIMGQVGQVGPDAFNARRVAILAGVPVTATAWNVNRLCGSGVQAIWSAAQSVVLGPHRVVVAGGNENMTMQPFLDYRARDGYRLGDRTSLDGSLSLVTDALAGYPMGVTGERVAQRFGVSRQDQDTFAVDSHRKAISAIDEGRFESQIVPVPVEGRDGTTFASVDEHPRRDTTLQKLASLPPAFEKDGTVTAGNSSGINDAAAAVVVTTAANARALGIRPRVTVVDVAVAGIEPEIMGYAPTFAIRRLLERNRMTPSDIDVLELNEAFASVALAVIRDTGFDHARVNPNGGAIALGHPVGATGTILTVKAIHELTRRNAEHAIVSLCIGGGQGIAALLRNVR